MTQRKRLEGTLASWHPHPKAPESLVPVVRDAAPVDGIADRFFDSAPQLHTPEPPFAVETVEPRVAIDSATVRARRRYLMRYVAGAVSVASLIGLAAIVRLTTARDASAADGFASHRSSNATSNAASVSDLPRAEVAPMASAVAMEPSAAIDVVPPVVAPPSESATEVVAALAPAAPASGTASEDVAAVAPPAPAATEVEPSEATPSPAVDAPSAAETRAAREPGSESHGAAEAKRESQRDLERGRFTKSIAAGERSVSLDPTDADAWLVLGAAYQAKGRFAEARRCFVTCSHRAKRGARSECRALLR